MTDFGGPPDGLTEEELDAWRERRRIMAIQAATLPADGNIGPEGALIRSGQARKGLGVGYGLNDQDRPRAWRDV